MKAGALAEQLASGSCHTCGARSLQTPRPDQALEINSSHRPVQRLGSMISAWKMFAWKMNALPESERTPTFS